MDREPDWIDHHPVLAALAVAAWISCALMPAVSFAFSPVSRWLWQTSFCASPLTEGSGAGYLLP